MRKHDGGGVEMFRAALQAAPTAWSRAGGCRPNTPASWPAAQVDKLEDFAKGFGARGLARARIGAGGAWTQSPVKT